MNYFTLVLFTLFLVMIPQTHALTCSFAGWDIPKLSSDNTIILDNETWIAIDSNQDDEYIRRITIQSLQGLSPTLNPLLPNSFYLDLANDFLERNNDDLKIASYSDFTVREDIEIPKTVDFLGESQYCYNIPVVGTFAGAIEFTDDKIYAITSKWFAPIIIVDVVAELLPEEIGINATEDDLVILKDGDEFKLAYETEQDEHKKYYDADTGAVIEREDQTNLPDTKTAVKITVDSPVLIIISLVSLAVVGFLIFMYFSHKP